MLGWFFAWRRRNRARNWDRANKRGKGAKAYKNMVRGYQTIQIGDDGQLHGKGKWD